MTSIQMNDARVFRTPKHPLEVDMLMTKTWRLAVLTGKEHLDPVWEDRARKFWERFERIYGVKMSNFTLLSDTFEDTGPVISTYSVIKAILPGDRVDGFKLN